jgi:hypothetical protein
MLPRLIPAVVSLLTLGAHFLRRGQIAACVVCVALCALLALRRAWVPLLLQAALAVGTVEWLGTTVLLTRARAHEGGPVLRLVLILGSVTAFTAASAWLVGSRHVRAHYTTPAPPVESA